MLDGDKTIIKSKKERNCVTGVWIRLLQCHNPKH